MDTPRVSGIFTDRLRAEQALLELQRADFPLESVGFLMRDPDEAKTHIHTHIHNKTTDAAAGGSIVGGTVGGLAVATGALVIPGLGPLIALGALGGIITASVLGGAVGWLVGALTGIGMPEDEAAHYERRIEQGCALITVDAPVVRIDEAETILRRNGAEDLLMRANTWGAVPVPTVAMEEADESMLVTSR